MMTAAALARTRRPWFDRGAHSPHFRRWFGSSLVVDRRGRPLVVYHGTNDHFPAFAPPGDAEGRHPTSALGIFFSSDAEVAALFAGDDPGACIRPVYLSIKNPWVMGYGIFSRHWMSLAEKDERAAIDAANWFRQALEDQGHDGILILRARRKAVRWGTNEWTGDTWVAFHPEQIKSVFTRGALGEVRACRKHAQPSSLSD
jgi:ADP-Ribosyltransferase in polyvalent proteins